MKGLKHGSMARGKTGPDMKPEVGTDHHLSVMRENTLCLWGHAQRQGHAPISLAQALGSA